MAHNSQCLLRKVCIFPSAYQKSMLLISATNQNVESQGAGTDAMSRTGKLCQPTMDTFGFKQSCKDYLGSGREWAMRSPCCSVWKDTHLSPPLAMFGSTNRGEKGSLRCLHQLPPSYQCLLTLLGTSAEFWHVISHVTFNILQPSKHQLHEMLSQDT